MEVYTPYASIIQEIAGDLPRAANPNLPKVEMLVAESEETQHTCVTFVLREETHTLANILRACILNNPEVEFCGYSMPHPTDAQVNIRVQTYDTTTAREAFQKGLDDVMEMCAETLAQFQQKWEQQEGEWIGDEEL